MPARASAVGATPKRPERTPGSQASRALRDSRAMVCALRSAAAISSQAVDLEQAVSVSEHPANASATVRPTLSAPWLRRITQRPRSLGPRNAPRARCGPSIPLVVVVRQVIYTIMALGYTGRRPSFLHGDAVDGARMGMHDADQIGTRHVHRTMNRKPGGIQSAGPSDDLPFEITLISEDAVISSKSMLNGLSKKWCSLPGTRADVITRYVDHAEKVG